MRDVKIVPISSITIPDNNIRKANGIDELKKSISANGLLQPVGVIEDGEDKYKLIFGFRRMKAIQDLKHETVAVSIFDFAETGTVSLSLAENVIRQDMKESEVAMTIRSLHEYQGVKIRTLANRIGITEKKVRYYLKLSNVIPEILEILNDDNLDEIIQIAEYPMEFQVTEYAKIKEEYDEVKPWHLINALEKHSNNLLSDAPWSQTTPIFGPACDKCTQKSNSCNSLMEQLYKEEDAFCLDKECWNDKLNALEAIVSQASDENDCKQIPWPHHWLNAFSGYTPAEQEEHPLDLIENNTAFNNLLSKYDAVTINFTKHVIAFGNLGEIKVSVSEGKTQETEDAEEGINKKSVKKMGRVVFKKLVRYCSEKLDQIELFADDKDDAERAVALAILDNYMAVFISTPDPSIMETLHIRAEGSPEIYMDLLKHEYCKAGLFRSSISEMVRGYSQWHGSHKSEVNAPMKIIGEFKNLNAWFKNACLDNQFRREIGEALNNAELLSLLKSPGKTKKENVDIFVSETKTKMFPSVIKTLDQMKYFDKNELGLKYQDIFEEEKEANECNTTESTEEYTEDTTTVRTSEDREDNTGIPTTE